MLSSVSVPGLVSWLATFTALAGCHYRPPATQAPQGTLEVVASYPRQDGVLHEVVRIDGAALATPKGTETPRRWSTRVRVPTGPFTLEFQASFTRYDLSTRPAPLPPGCPSRAASVVMPGDCANALSGPVLHMTAQPLANCRIERKLAVGNGEHLTVIFSFHGDGDCDLCLARPGQEACEPVP